MKTGEREVEGQISLREPDEAREAGWAADCNKPPLFSQHRGICPWAFWVKKPRRWSSSSSGSGSSSSSGLPLLYKYSLGSDVDLVDSPLNRGLTAN